MHPFLKKNIIFYDGDCGLCHRAVQILIRWDNDKKLYFSALQNETSQGFLKGKSLNFPYLSTLVYWDQTRVYEKSDAFLQALLLIPKLKKWALLAQVFPKFFRNWIYDIFAQNRLNWFEQPTCQIPPNEDPSRWV